MSANPADSALWAQQTKAWRGLTVQPRRQWSLGPAHSSQAGLPVRHRRQCTAGAAHQRLAGLTVRHSGHLLEWSKARWKQRRQKLWPQGVVIG